MPATKKKQELRYRRRRRIRAKVYGTADRPRISVFKSNTAVYAQLIDDERGATLASSSTKQTGGDTPTDRAFAAGKELAQAASKQKIDKAVFDRGGYIYTGRVKALADGVREGGLQF